MSTYSNRLQPALQNLLQRVVRFFHPEIVMHDDAYIGGRYMHDDLGWKNQSNSIYSAASLTLRVIFSIS